MILLALTCAALAMIAWSQHRRLRTLEDQLASATRQRDDAQERLVAADVRRTELEAQAAASPRPPDNAPTAAAAPAPVTAPLRRGPPGFSAMLNNPDFQRAMLAGIRGNLDQRYATLFRKLKLPPAELDKLKNLLVDRQAAGFDVLAVASADGLAGQAGPEGLRALMEKTQADVDESIRAVLGEERFAQYKDYDRNAASYSVADQLAQRLSYSPTPLAGAQADELVRILAETAPAPASAPANDRARVAVFGGGNPIVAPFLGGNAAILAAGGQSPITDDALERARDILTPDQFEALKEIQAEQQALAKLPQLGRGGVNFQRAGGAVQPATPVPPPGG